MGSLIKILIIAAIIGVCFYIPKGFNEFFEGKYNTQAISWPLAAISALLLILSVILGCNGGWVFWILFSIFILSLVFSSFCCAKNAKTAGASTIEAIFAIIMQLLATAGIIVFVVLLFAALRNLDKKRKK